MPPGGRHFCQSNLLPDALALLIGDAAAGLAGGLARGLALAATAMGSALLQGCAVQSLDMSHGYLSSNSKD